MVEVVLEVSAVAPKRAFSEAVLLVASGQSTHHTAQQAVQHAVHHAVQQAAQQAVEQAVQQAVERAAKKDCCRYLRTRNAREKGKSRLLRYEQIESSRSLTIRSL